MAKQTFTTGQVLTAAQMTSLQQTAMGGGSATAKTASYVLVAADAGTTVAMNAAGATTITVNTSLFAAGDTVTIQNLGAGTCTITAGTATVNTSSSLALAQYEGGELYFVSASAAIFFKSDGAAATSGGMTLISEQTASANSSLSFTSIPGTYKQLFLVWSGIYHSGSGSVFSLRFNNNSTANAYKSNFLSGTGLTAIACGSTEASYIEAYGTNHMTTPFGVGVNNSTSVLYTMSSGWLEIDNYTSTSKYKIFHGDYHYYKNPATAGYTSVQIMGSWENTSAITSLDIVRISGSDTFTNVANTSIRLYGIS